MRRIAFGLFITGLTVAAWADVPPPRDPARVAVEVLPSYAGHHDLEVGRRAEWAAKGNAHEVEYLTALSKQCLADEPNGRWVKDRYYFGTEAGYMLHDIAHALGDVADSDKCLDLVLWYIDNDPDCEDVTSVAPALGRIKAAKTVNILGRLIDHPNDAVAVNAIEQAGMEHLQALGPAIALLSGSYRTAVREAARGQAEALHFAPRDYVPQEAFTPWLDKQLQAIGETVSVTIPKDAVWKHFTYADVKNFVHGKPVKTELGGWLIGQDGEAYHLVDWNGLECTLAKANTEIAARTLREEAEGLPAAVDGVREGGGRFAGHVEIGLYMPAKFMIGAWLHERGEDALAAKLLFPILLKFKDQREPIAQVRNEIAQRYRTAMLWKFGGQHDYAAAGRLAKHLSGPAFDGWRLQKEAALLAEQLAQRKDDFVTLKLPSSEEWARLKVTLTRAQQAEYLAVRLRLLFAPQRNWGWGGFEMDQYANPLASLHFEAGKPWPQRVINPYVELLAMKLAVSELPPLLPHLFDESFMLGYDLEFAARGGPTALQQVDQAMALVVNDAAAQTLVDDRYLESLDQEGKRQYLKTIAAWVDTHAQLTRRAVLLESLRSAKMQGDFFVAAQELAVLGAKEAAPIIIQRFNDISENPQETSSVAMLLYHLDPQSAAAPARAWLKSDGYHLKFWAAMILVHSGNKNADEGWPELLSVLKEHNNNQYVPHAFDVLLASNRQDARAFAVSVLKNRELMQWDGASYVHRLLLAGCKEALDYQLELLDNAMDAGGGFTMGDRAAAGMSRWRNDKYVYDKKTPPEQRAAEREKLKQWLTDQFALIQAGRPSEIRPPNRPLMSVQWNFPPLPGG